MLRENVSNQLDPLRFAYSKGRGTGDAINSLMHLVLNHLEDFDANARGLFIDFSSAFNTIQLYILIRKLKQLGVNPTIIQWYHSFLSNRTQRVKVNNSFSQEKIL